MRLVTFKDARGTRIGALDETGKAAAAIAATARHTAALYLMQFRHILDATATESAR